MTGLKPRFIKKWKTRLPTNVKGANAKTIATKALETAKRTAARVGKPEVKYINTGPIGVSQTNFNNTGATFYLSGCTEGTDNDERIGDQIRPTYIRFRMNIYKGLAAGVGGTLSQQQTIRVILFQDRENRQALPAVTEVLQDAGCKSQYDMDNSNRFIILKDELMVMDQYNTVKLFTYNGKLKRNIHYKSSLNTIAAADEGSVFLLVLSDVVVVNGSPTAEYDSRISFTDA